MVKCATGCDPLIYKGYGCYCGFLGSGKYLDGIDLCCNMHDYCYTQTGCPMFLEYFVPYVWKCYKGSPLCGENFFFFFNFVCDNQFFLQRSTMVSGVDQDPVLHGYVNVIVYYQSV